MAFARARYWVVGTLLTIVYTSDIGSILTATSGFGHLYADDRRSILCLHCLAFSATAAVRSMSQTPRGPEPFKNPLYLICLSAAACKARHRRHRCRLPLIVSSGVPDLGVTCMLYS